MTPGQAATALADLPITETLTTSLATQAAALAEAVHANLATQPGGPHDHPWRHTGALQASIALTSNALTAQIGSNHPASAPQELGTTALPPARFSHQPPRASPNPSPGLSAKPSPTSSHAG